MRLRGQVHDEIVLACHITKERIVENHQAMLGCLCVPHSAARIFPGLRPLEVQTPVGEGNMHKHVHVVLGMRRLCWTTNSLRNNFMFQLNMQGFTVSHDSLRQRAAAPAPGGLFKILVKVLHSFVQSFIFAR
jgi:hypothetical protein